MNNILYIIPSLLIGGAEVLVTEIAIYLKKLGTKATILTFVPSNTHLVQLLKDHNIEIVVPNPSSKKHTYYSLSNIFFLYLYLRNNNFAIVHAHLSPAQLTLACVNLILKRKIPFVTTEHSTHNKRRNKWWFRLIDYLMYKQFDKIIAISPATKDALADWIPYTKERCDVILNGINLEKFKNKKDTNLITLKKENLCVLSIGRFFHQKGHSILLKAFALTSGMELYLAGDGPIKNDIMQLAKKLKISNRVHFLGVRSDIKELIHNSDIYVQSSLWEGFGIATLEAMAGGIPVIVSDVAGLSEVVKDSGMKFPCGNHVKLAKCLTLLGEDKALREKLSALSQERAKEFSLEKTIKKYYELYEECTALYERFDAK